MYQESPEKKFAVQTEIVLCREEDSEIRSVIGLQATRALAAEFHGTRFLFTRKKELQHESMGAAAFCSMKLVPLFPIGCTFSR